MSGVELAIMPSYEEYQKGRYIEYIESLGANIDFNNDKWICDKKKRNGKILCYYSFIT